MTNKLTLNDTPWSDVLYEHSDYIVYADGYAVTDGHCLFVPKHNVPFVIDECLTAAMAKGRAMVDAGECDGFNVGINQGSAAGQTVMYPHIHLIPRRYGDMEDPRGGIRNVIPAKGNYLKGK